MYFCQIMVNRFVDLKDNILYFKTKGGVIVFGDINARTRYLQHDEQ